MEENIHGFRGLWGTYSLLHEVEYQVTLKFIKRKHIHPFSLDQERGFHKKQENINTSAAG
jgi:hypothetical protein